MTLQGESSQTRVIPRWAALILMEFWAIAQCWFFTGFDPTGLVMSHLWAAFYSGLGLIISQKKEWSALVDGFPLWNYALALFNHLIALPILFSCSVYIAPSLETWLHVGVGRNDVFAKNLFYSIIGCMLKDLWLTKEHPVTLMSIGYLIHHMITIAGCAISLSLEAGFGFACIGAFVIELGSGLFDIHMVMQRPRTLMTYLCTMPISNIVGTVSAANVWFLAQSTMPLKYHDYKSVLVVILTVVLCCMRQYAWVMHINIEWQAVTSASDKALLSKSLLKKVC